MAVRGFQSGDQHVFGHPLVFAGDVRGDAQGEAFFSQQGVAAVSGAIGPDFAGVGKMTDVFVIVARPARVRLSRFERTTDRVHARDELAVAVALFR